MKRINRIVTVILSLIMILLLIPLSTTAFNLQKADAASDEFEVDAAVFNEKSIDPSTMDNRLIGDYNNDRVITAADARIALRTSVGLEKYLSPAQLYVMDVNHDGEIHSSDARLILRMSVQLESIMLIKVINIPVEEPTEPSKPIKPDNPSEADEYYWENSEEVLEVIDAEKSASVQTEEEAIIFLAERGFTDYEVTYDSTITGEFLDDTEAVEGSSTKHPMYQTFYKTPAGDVWSVFIINGKIFANPASYNLDSELEAELLVSESNQLTSYDDEGNQFYVTIPKSTAVIVKTVSRIDTQTLDSYVFD